MFSFIEGKSVLFNAKIHKRNIKTNWHNHRSCFVPLKNYRRSYTTKSQIKWHDQSSLPILKVCLVWLITFNVVNKKIDKKEMGFLDSLNVNFGSPFPFLKANKKRSLFSIKKDWFIIFFFFQILFFLVSDCIYMYL